MRILIADDELTSRRLLQKTLERAGYDVTAVENGRAAADELCKPEGPKLALLDWVMPELDGPGVCREVRKQNEQSYVYMILLTPRANDVPGDARSPDLPLEPPCNDGTLRTRTGALAPRGKVRCDLAGRFGSFQGHKRHIRTPCGRPGLEGNSEALAFVGAVV